MALQKIIIITVLLGVWKSEQQELYLPPPDAAGTNLVAILKSENEFGNGELTVPGDNGNLSDKQLDLSQNNGNVKLVTLKNENVGPDSSTGENIPLDNLVFGFGLEKAGNKNTIIPQNDISLSSSSDNEFNSEGNVEEGVKYVDGKSDEPNLPKKESQFGGALKRTSDSESENTNTDSITIISDNGISTNGINIINNKDISIMNGNIEALPNGEKELSINESTSPGDVDDKDHKFNNNEANSEPNIEILSRAIAGGGIAGADYPILYYIPETSFTCPEGPNIDGYFADTHPSSRCQVFHICQSDGRMDSFLCPVGTLFNQKHFVCDWWFNVDCSSSVDYYSLNERIGRVESKNQITLDDKINVAEEKNDEQTNIALETNPDSELQETDSEFAKRTLFDGADDKELINDLTSKNVSSSFDDLNLFETDGVGDNNKKDVNTFITEISNDSILSSKNEEIIPNPLIQEQEGLRNEINEKEALQKSEEQANTELGVTIPEDGITEPGVSLSEVIKTQDLNKENTEENLEKEISPEKENQSTVNTAKQLRTKSNLNSLSNSRVIKSNTKSRRDINLNKRRAEQTRQLNSYGVSTAELQNKKNFRN